ncbi:MAG: META domain-containing protein [Roseobacter sp.]|jgi:heat shock protein HslJ|nr:META domain-containing protein [Roseobacter sp.]
MKRILKSLALCAAFLGTTPAMAEQLPGSEWGPTELNGSAFAPIKDVFIRFDQDGRFFGSGGCNTMRGSFVTNGDAILMGPAATTMMACPEDQMKQEYEFLQALNSIRGFDRDGTTLTLSDGEGVVVMVLQQRDAD